MTSCLHCSEPLEEDAASPFCDDCWFKAVHRGDPAVTVTMARWMLRLDDSDDDED